MVIVVGGMIGLGKTTVTKILSEALNGEPFYEDVKGNKLLELFYNSTDEEIQRNRYPFLLQLDFLNSRFKMIKKACIKQNNVLDRSIYEDLYFCQKNMELGRISELEFYIYNELLGNMMEELKELPKKSPDLMVYLKGSLDTVLKRINKRGREYEIDEKLKDYYKYIWEGYDEWIEKNYNKSDVLIVDMDKVDVINNENDKLNMIKEVVNKLQNNNM